jgi:hypothetical protein
VITVLGLLRRQIESGRRLLGTMLAQNEAIRRQDVDRVLTLLADIQRELAERSRLEQERDEILAAAAMSLGRPAADLVLEDVLTLAPAAEVDPARLASAELKGLLVEIGRVHDCNRVLIRQELSFLDHLMRVMSGTPQAGYRPGGAVYAPQTYNTVNARA